MWQTQEHNQDHSVTHASPGDVVNGELAFLVGASLLLQSDFLLAIEAAVF